MNYTAKITTKDLKEYLELVSKFKNFNKFEQFANSIKAINAWKDKSATMPEPQRRVESRWYASVKNGKPDYSVYDDDYFISECWVCWVTYSSKYVKLLADPKGCLNKSVVSLALNPKTVADLGCGVGYTTKVLRDIFPNAKVFGTNLEGTFQYKVGCELGKKYDFGIVPDVSFIKENVDFIFASEYFEHFQRPIEHLDEILGIHRPRVLVLANAFTGDAIGHFDFYLHKNELPIDGKKMSKKFNDRLRGLGYRKEKTRFWNNRPTVWVKL